MFSMYILSLILPITTWISFFALQHVTRKNLQIILYSTTRGKWDRWAKTVFGKTDYYKVFDTLRQMLYSAANQ